MSRDLPPASLIEQTRRAVRCEHPPHLVCIYCHTPAAAVIREIYAERDRQIGAEGWDVDHDDEHDRGELAAAAACYALPVQELRTTVRTEQRDIAGRGECPQWAKVRRAYRIPRLWPKSWHPSWWKPKDRRRDLIRAAALIVAEIERLDRAAPKARQA